MSATLRELTDRIRDNNVRKGFRPAEGGPGTNTWGDYIALLHSELSEALEAYRDHRLEDATRPPRCAVVGCERWTMSNPRPKDADFAYVDKPCPPDHFNLAKPEGVGSELADVLIRLVDMCDVFGFRVFDMDCEIGDVSPTHEAIIERAQLVSFGDWVAWLHKGVAKFGDSRPYQPDTFAGGVLRRLVAMAERLGIDLEAEVLRKTAYNATRAFQHGGRTLDGAMQTPVTRNIEK